MTSLDLFLVQPYARSLRATLTSCQCPYLNWLCSSSRKRRHARNAFFDFSLEGWRSPRPRPLPQVWAFAWFQAGLCSHRPPSALKNVTRARHARHPEPQENVWQFMRENCPLNRIFK
jgi:hypothetical protein